MLNLLNGSDRTALQFHDILEKAGWKTVRIFRNPGFQIENAKVIAVPA